MLLIVVLCLVTLAQHGFKIDHAQFEVSSLPLSGLGLGVVVAIFSLVGFECCDCLRRGGAGAAQDDSARGNRLEPALDHGVFFVIVTYSEVLGFARLQDDADKIDAPLNVVPCRT